MSISNELWGASRTDRLSSARNLTSEELSAVHDDLRRGRVEPNWPYGSATSINPLLVILGASPGNSPTAWRPQFRDARTVRPAYGRKAPLWCVLPGYDGLLGQGEGARANTSGPRWRTRRRCTRALRNHESRDRGERKCKRRSDLTTPLRDGCSPPFADGLRPRVLVLLGLRGRLKELSRLFVDAFEGLDVRRPHHEYALERYQIKRLVFREWELAGNHGSPMLLVDWPQHPSRSPFSDPLWWRVACEQFAARRSSLFE